MVTEGFKVPVDADRRFPNVRLSVPVLHLHSPSFRYVVVGTKIKNDEHNGTDYETDKIKKQDKSEDLSCLVDQTGKFSNLLEDLKKLDDFANSI